MNRRSFLKCAASLGALPVLIGLPKIPLRESEQPVATNPYGYQFIARGQTVPRADWGVWTSGA